MKRNLLIVLIMAGCSPVVLHTDGSPDQHACLNGTDGQYGVACFAWQSTPDLTVPIAAGSRSTIKVASDLGFMQVGSSNPSVALFDLSGSTIEVQAIEPGFTDLVLEDSMGRIVDRATIVVADNVALGSSVYGGATHVAVLAGSSQRFHVSTIGPGGVGTVGVGAVTFSVQGLANLSTLFVKEGDETGFWGYQGHGSIIARAGSAISVLDVDFLSESAVTSIDLYVTSIDLRLDGTAVAKVVSVAQTTYGQLYGAACHWSGLSVSAVTQSAYGIDHAAASESHILLGQSGTTYAATCAIGSRQAMVNLRF